MTREHLTVEQVVAKLIETKSPGKKIFAEGCSCPYNHEVIGVETTDEGIVLRLDK